MYSIFLAVLGLFVHSLACLPTAWLAAQHVHASVHRHSKHTTAKLLALPKLVCSCCAKLSTRRACTPSPRDAWPACPQPHLLLSKHMQCKHTAAKLPAVLKAAVILPCKSEQEARLYSISWRCLACLSTASLAAAASSAMSVASI